MISSPDSDEEIKIHFNLHDEKFSVSYYTFCSYSKKFRKDFNNKEYKVNSDVPKTSFNAFLSACQGKYYMVDDSNILDLIKLCIEFECNGIKNDIIKFTEQRNKKSIISSYSSLFISESNGNSNSGVDDLADRIAKDLNLYIDEESLLSLNNDALSKILFNKNRANVTESQIFNVIKAKYDKYKDGEYELYSHLHLNDLGKEDINYLLTIKPEKMPKSFDTESFWPFLVKTYNSLKENNKIIEELQEKLKKMDEDFEKKTGPINAKIDDYNTWREGKEKEYGELSKKNQDLAKEYQDLQQKYDKLKEEFQKIAKDQEKNDKEFAKRYPFKGIIYSMKKDKKNIEEFIEIKTPAGTDANAQKYNPYDLFEYEGAKMNNCYYHNLKKTEQNEENWIDFYFKQKPKYKLYGFSLRTSCFGQCFSHPKKFKIMGSDNGNEWEEIFKVDDEDQYLNGSCLSHTYIFEKNDKIYSYIRFLQTDAHFQYKDRFGIIALSAIEFFGNEA